MSEEYGPNFVTLTDEEGNDIELEYIDALEHNGTTYMAFFPVVEEGEEENEDEYGLIILKSETVDGEAVTGSGRRSAQSVSPAAASVAETVARQAAAAGWAAVPTTAVW